MENIETVSKLISPGIFKASLDLEDVYLIDSRIAQKMLTFYLPECIVRVHGITVWAVNGSIYHKNLQTSGSFSERRGIFISNILYLDDFLLFGDSIEECSLKETLRILKSLGFVINP